MSSKIKNSEKVGKMVRFRLDGGRGRWVYGTCIDCVRLGGRDFSHVDFGGSFLARPATSDLEVISA